MSAYGPSVTPAAKSAGDAARTALTTGSFAIFKGPLEDNKGGTVIPAGTVLEMTNLELEKMNYLVEMIRAQGVIVGWTASLADLTRS
jgi:basic membrane protein A